MTIRTVFIRTVFVSLAASLCFTFVQTVTAATIPPSPMDLLVDSDSYVPPFFNGRALPSAGTNIRLVAIPYFKLADGSAIPAANIIFTWKQDDRVIGNASGLGKASIILPAAMLYGTTNIEVDAQSADSAPYAVATISIPSIDPALVLYEDNPLLGFTYYHAFGATASIQDVEMTFAVVPYFAHIQNPNDPALRYVWKVNGSNIATDPRDPSEITINAKNSTGIATIDLSLTQSNNIFMSPTASWNISIGGGTTVGTNNSNTGTTNPFTGQ